MPKIVSKAQNRWARWAAKNGRGSQKKAARDAIKEFHGRTTRGMPERKGKKSSSRRRSR